MPLPNFLLIGPPKCGTTALYATLARHPQVFMSPVKEPYFFAFDGEPIVFGGPDGAYFQRHAVASQAAYADLFAAAGNLPVIGEASTIYLSSYQPEKTATRIHNALPMARLVAVLRQPVDRAYSAFTDMRARGLEPLSDFGEALAAEPQRTANNWRPGFRYWQNGLYAQNLIPYYERFPPTHVRIYLYEDWRDRPQTMLADLCNFLEIDPARLPVQVLQHNVTRWVRYLWLERLIKRGSRAKQLLPVRLRRAISAHLRFWNQVKPPPLDPALQNNLTERYRDELMRLQDLIGRDLRHWLYGVHV
ncbi:sulfotransferase [Candidatus Chloroploca sp. Khr17]|uniref:sulfotransferase n=1 Tax=Candidatus Chloroploca sp. Khr17 TaxID=2496869 RepID=UPI00101D4A81|nr:sulfotransferase [Candidatus Chloroploca sp. Khr17]